MVWSNWQRAIWRGAGVMLLFWSGLAWTQTPAPPSPGGANEPTMVVHDENGKSTRCRVLETWQLPDGRKAHLLETLGTAEKITIVTEPSPASNPRAMPIRIFAWGRGQATPPAGSPLPPHMRLDSGVVIKNETPFPADGIVGGNQTPKVVNRTDDTALGGSFAPPGPQNIERVPVRPIGSGLVARLFPGRFDSQTQDPQVIYFPGGPPAQAPGSVIQTQGPAGGENFVVRADRVPYPDDKGVVNAAGTDKTACNPVVPVQVAIGQPIVPGPGNNANSPPCVVGGVPLPPVPSPAANSQPPAATSPGADVGPLTVVAVEVPPNTDAVTSAPVPVADPVRPMETKKSWRPGEKIASWWQSLSAKPEARPEVPPEPVVINPQTAKTDDKVKQADDFLTQQNKVAEKKLQERAEKVYKGGFSTAMNPTPPELKKPEPAPLAIPGQAPTPAKEEKVAALAPLPPPPSDNPKPAAGSDQEKHDMFGAAGNQATAPGRAALETPRREDPLMAPDRITTPKANVLPPLAREIRPPADPNVKNPWPPGAQSVLAARGGLEGPVTYVPVPTVTVPQPNYPPTPPPPAMPEAPQLNAYVNAFSAPKNAPQMPQQGMMPTQAMMPYGNPMMANNPMMPYVNPMMQPMPYGYPQMPAYAMNPYGMQGPMMNPMMGQQMPYRQPMAVSQGPTANYSRQYIGPMPPQNPFGAPTMPAGYGYPPQQPMMPPQQPMMPPQQPMMPPQQPMMPPQQPMMPPQQPMMPPQQPMIQPANYQQAMPSAQAQQVEQLIKVMRENAYPAQREWAAQMLANYEWRVHPQIVPALLQSAGQDPAATVRAGCVTCLGRMQAAVEPVFGTLHALRSDIDPRVRSAVEQAFVNLGQTPMAPQ
jgi:hypothetical protein